MGSDHPAVRRITEEVGVDLVDMLTRLSGPDLTSTLIAVAARRAAQRTPATVARQYRDDRFVRPAAVDELELRRVEDIALATSPRFEPVRLAPVVPLGTHSVLGGISQHRVIGTHRGTEIAADPTNGLALEAAARRRTAREPVDLSAVQRVTRAQRFDGPVSFAHFSLFGLVSADRDRGNHDAEVDLMVRHVDTHLEVIEALGLEPAAIRLTDFGPDDRTVRRIEERVRRRDLVTRSPEREAGRGYYPSLCFKIDIAAGDEILEVVDGGLTDWTAELLNDRKERLMISGAGVDRLATARQHFP